MNQLKLINNLTNKENIHLDNILKFLLSYSLEEIKEINPPVSFDFKEEIPISYWNDKQWSFNWNKGQNKDFKYTIDWNEYNELNNNYLEELKYLILTIYYKKYTFHKDSKFIQKILLHIRIFMNKCQKLNLSGIQELSNELNFINVMEKMKGEYAFRTLQNHLISLRTINEINNPHFPCRINISKNGVAENKGFDLKELSKKYSVRQSDDVNQTLYIPNKIHSKLIYECINVIENKSNILDNMMSFLEEDYILYENIKNELNITKVDKSNYEKIRWRKRQKTKEMFKIHHLEKFNAIHEIQKEVRLLAIASAILILNFSGMRINELLNIETDGFKVVNSEPKLYVIRSYETKLTSGQVVDYITSPIVKNAFDILIKIHSLAKKYDKTIDPKKLFIVSQDMKLLSYGGYDLGTHIKDFATEMNLIIDNEDVKESELLNGPREEIKKGKIWPLLSHQFRRTLIINFVSHHLGTINAVKQQVKHMYATMTEYYAKNSKLAEKFSLNVVQEISNVIEEELLNEGVRQYKEFYYSNELLAGVKGQAIMEERQNIKVLSDNEIKQLFKTGLYQISRSLYGYCTKGNLCDKKEVIDPTFCGANCSTMIITKENANNWQKLYFRNKKLLETELTIGGVPMSGAKTTMQSQNEVAKKIMNQFNMKYEG